MNQIACSSFNGHTAITSLNYLRPLYAALPLMLAGTTAATTSRSITTTGVREFSTPVRTFNKLQFSAASQTPLTSGAIAIVRHFSSSQSPGLPLYSYQIKPPTNRGIRFARESKACLIDRYGSRRFYGKADLIPKESKKITWVIKNFPSFQSESIHSDPFVVGGCKWSLEASPIGDDEDNYLSLFLKVHDYESLPPGWRRHAGYHLTILNHQDPDKNLQQDCVIKAWYNENAHFWDHTFILPLDKLVAQDSGFLVNGELKIVAKIDLFESIGVSVTEETTMSTVTETKKVKFMTDAGLELDLDWLHKELAELLEDIEKEKAKTSATKPPR
ncbi:unnamed protein product [Microthlaspi erraticum]|uniref:MATH domain-containing protein n=1 Tax=Microthlaspi erraticum TaxID=1685480 RepID=A0A6D2LBL3_9BRAS|nr:unnamed protein product [Microthlaspi erraticum]